MHKEISLLLIAPIFFIKCYAGVVSTNLCIDRLLVEIAPKNNIKSLTFLSLDPSLTLKEADQTIAINNGKLADYTPYYNDLILYNEASDIRLINKLKKLGFKTKQLNLPNSRESLITTIQDIGLITKNESKANDLIQQLKKPKALSNDATKALIIAEQGVISNSPTANMLLSLIGAKNSIEANNLNQKLKFEQLFKIKTQVVIVQKYNSSYSQASFFLEHEALQHWLNMKETIYLDSKYTICFDHGVWQAAKMIKDKEY